MTTTITAMEIISLIASVASLILAVTAIALSVVFFRMSTELMDKTKDAASRIGASVERLEILFDRLYSDTFSMMKDTVTDMRQHIWPGESLAKEKIAEEAEKKAQERVASLRAEMEAEVSSTLRRQEMTEDQVKSTYSELTRVLENAILTSREVEIDLRKEFFEGIVSSYLDAAARLGRAVTARDIIEDLRESYSTLEVLQELNRMRGEGQLTAFPDSSVAPGTTLRRSPKT